MDTSLKAELIEVFTKQINARIRYQFEAITAKFGPSIKGVYNSTDGLVWKESVSLCCDRNDDVYSLSEERLARFAAVLADEMADDVLAKVDAKVGELADAEVIRVSGADFRILGAKNNNAVTIEQQQILNVSSRGKLFNQFPSRIYVNGKFTPASKFAQI
jgi:hypothetical protein